MVNWEERARAQLAGASGTHWITRDDLECVAHDSGDVSPHVLPALRSLAQRHGYKVKYTGDLPGDPSQPGECVLGRTHGRRNGGVVEIRRGMSDASTARTLAHELGHVLANATTDFDSRIMDAKIRAVLGLDEDSTEETACELGAAVFCAAAGIGTGRFLKLYLSQRPGYSDRVFPDAARNAQALWHASQEYQYQHLAS